MSIQHDRTKGRQVLQELNPRPNSTSPYSFNRDHSEPKTGIDQPSKEPLQKPLLPKRKSKKVNYQPVPPSVKLEAALEEAADRHFAHSTSVSLDPAINSLEIKLDAIRLGKTSVLSEREPNIKAGQTGLVRKGGLVDPEKDPGLDMKAESPVDRKELHDGGISEGEQTEMGMDLDMDIVTNMKTQKEKEMDMGMDKGKGKVKVTEEGVPKRIKPKKSVSFASMANVRMLESSHTEQQERPSRSFGMNVSVDALMKAYWEACGSSRSRVEGGEEWGEVDKHLA